MTTPAATSIIYPESDGMPLPDGEYQAPLYRQSRWYVSRTHFRRRSGRKMNGDTFIYYVEGDPRRSVSPDCYVVFGLSDARPAIAVPGREQHLSAVGSGQGA